MNQNFIRHLIRQFRDGLLLIVSLTLCPYGFAQNYNAGNVKALYIEYHGEPNSTGLVSIKVKEQKSGAAAQLLLEPQPNSTGVWHGYFSIQFVRGDQSPKILEFLDKAGAKLFTYSEPQKGVQTVTLFKNQELLQEYKAQLVKLEVQSNLENEAQQTVNVEPPPTLVSAPPPPAVPIPPAPAPVVALTESQKAQQEKFEAKKEENRELKQNQEQQQVSMEHQLVLEREQLRLEQEKMSAEIQKKNAELAISLALKGDAAYKEGKYEVAEKFYAKALEADPLNDKYYYHYGVTLYKVNNYNKSLAILALAEGEDVNTLEKEYYIALNHLKLKDYDKALKELLEIRSEDNPDLSPVASFFAGNIEFQNQKYPEARKSMEYVLDKSKDPQMDRAADTLLEQIDRIENFLSSLKEKYRLKLNVGLIDDSNILNMASNNLATDVAGFRANYGGGFLYHLYRTMEHDLSAEVTASDYYSVNSTMQSDATFQATDPLELAINLPYKGQFQVFSKNYTLDLTPTYKSLYMAPTGGNRIGIMNTQSLTTEVTNAVRPDWISKVKLEYILDTSLTTASTPEDEQSAVRYSLGTTQTKLLDLKGSKSLSGDLTYTQNDSKGTNNIYNKLAIGASYGFPSLYKSNGSVKIDYSSQIYTKTTTPRADKVWMLTLSSSKDLSKRTSLAITGQFTNNNSDQATYTYDKYMLSAALTHTISIQKK